MKAKPGPIRFDTLVGSIRGMLDEALRDLGRIELLVIGNTGAGKDTLTNAIFGFKIAYSGTGRPVTHGTTEHTHPHLSLSILDTLGHRDRRGPESVHRPARRRD